MEQCQQDLNISRLPASIQHQFKSLYEPRSVTDECLPINETHHGDARDLLPQISKNSVSLSVWSPPYFVGKNYESYLTYQDWESLLKTVIANHFKIIKPGGFLVINISDILCFKDETMPKIQAEVLTNKRCSVTREDVLAAMEENPDFNRYKIAKLLGCSEQTVDRRLNGNNIRGGKYDTQTRVKVVGGIIENFALDAGFYPYDRRVWVKDAAWENSRWASLSYRAVDEFEYIYVFWKPGITRIDRKRLTKDEWRQWGARGVWEFPSVRANDDHEAKFPVELPTRVIRLLTDPGELVLDCFMGSGTSAIAAINTDRNFIGIELDKKYADLANKQAQKAMKNAIRPK